MTKAEIQKELEKLQAEYNELHARLGYTYNLDACESINYCLDRINEKMLDLLEKRKSAK